MNPTVAPMCKLVHNLHMPALRTPSEGAGSVQLPFPSPTPRTGPARPPTGQPHASTGPRRPAAHRAPEPVWASLRVAAAIVAATLGTLAVILGLLAWVAIVAVAL